jgi:hypothetical protein
MTEREPHEERRREPVERGQDHKHEADRGPGAHSGREDLAHDRKIPGTASVLEGYQTEGGTAHGDPLEGLKIEEEDQAGGRRADGER